MKFFVFGLLLLLSCSKDYDIKNSILVIGSQKTETSQDFSNSYPVIKSDFKIDEIKNLKKSQDFIDFDKGCFLEKKTLKNDKNSVKIKPIFNRISVCDDVIYLTSENGNIAVYSEELVLKKEFILNKNLLGQSCLDDKLLVVSASGVDVVNDIEIKELHKIYKNNFVTKKVDPIASRDKIIIPLFNGYIDILDRKDFKVINKFNLEDRQPNIDSGIFLLEDRYLIFSNISHGLMSIDFSNISGSWQNDSLRAGTKVFKAINNFIVFGDYENKIHLVNLDNGKEKWSVKIDENIGHEIIQIDGEYFGIFGKNHVYLIDEFGEIKDKIKINFKNFEKYSKIKAFHGE